MLALFKTSAEVVATFEFDAVSFFDDEHIGRPRTHVNMSQDHNIRSEKMKANLEIEAGKFCDDDIACKSAARNRSVRRPSMGNRGRDRTKAVTVLAIALVGFLIALVIGYRYFELFDGVVAGLIILTIAGFIAYELWWKTNSEDR